MKTHDIKTSKDKPKLTITERVGLWWRFDGKFIFRNIRIGLSKIWYWLPVIWKDRDWDSYYIYEVLKHKLKAQSRYIGTRDIHTRAQQDARNMSICVNLIDKLQDDFYRMEYTDYVKHDHWFEPVPNEPEYSTWESEIVWEKYDEFFKKYPLIHKRVLNGEGPFSLNSGDEKTNLERIAMNISHINQQRAHKLLFKILEEEIEKWWD
jgi:hypothetical protein